MKKIKILFAFLTILCFEVMAQNPGDKIFNSLTVYKINIEFTYTNYWDSLLYYYEQGDEQYIPANITIDDTITYTNIGVRLKGNSSFSHPNNKKSFRLSFDEYNSALKWDGLKGFHLNNQYGDPTFMREKIYLDFCKEAGIPAPRINYTTLSINDTLFGFYSLIEHVDKKFLTSRYGNNGGDLFKASDAFEGVQAGSDFRWYTAVPDSYYNRYELKTDGSTTAWPNLINLLDSINNSSTVQNALSTTLNLNSIYRATATDILFANLDSYLNSGRNFYFYFNPATSKVEWIIWDVGLSFGDYGGGVSNFENLNLLYLINSAARPLLSKIYGVQQLKNQYLQTVCNLQNNYFTTSNLYPKIDSITAKIRPFVYADPRKQYSNNQFEMNINSDLNITGVAGTTRIPGLKSFITQRIVSVKNQLTNLGVLCGNGNINPGDVVINEFEALNDSILDPSNEAEDWIEFYNNTNAALDLSRMYLTDNTATLNKWQFPANSIIQPNNFLIVWADEDSGQVGLHANFKLSSTNGELIIFSDTSLSIIDSITFGPQTLNKSMQRIPNGIGQFTFGIPTFNALNTISSSVTDKDNTLPTDYVLRQNYPNPFNPTTIIEFSLPEHGNVKLVVYDILGKEINLIIHKEMSAGNYSVEFDATNLPAGVYFYRLESNSFSTTKKMIILK